MKTRARSMEQIVSDQIQKWDFLRKERKEEEPGVVVVTISREPGSGGKIVAGELAEKLGWDIFSQSVINDMAESANVTARFVETLDEKGVSVLEEWISSLVDDRHLWPDKYLQHLMKILGTIAKYGKAIILGRGANFVISPEKRYSVRIIAPREMRVQRVAEEFGVPTEEARRRVIKRESERRSFVRKYFNADIADPLHYDMVINTERYGIETAVNAIKSAIGK